jgi:S-adenosylmethionine:tRNA ribosyltransferase-isomerase
MKLSTFDYQLPKDLIAQVPLPDRSASRLMVVDRLSAKISHGNFTDLISYLAKEDSLVLNDTKVIPARIFGRRISGAKVEILLLEKGQASTFRCLLKGGRIKLNEKILLNGGSASAQLIAKDENAFIIRFEGEEDTNELINRIGVMPLPPYIKRQAQDSDRETYQTVYAKSEGAVAAPTAGLHFSQDLLRQIKSKGVKLGFVTLHVGWGTFQPIKSDDVSSHKMQEETFSLPSETVDLIKQTKEQGAKVFAVGTTSTRVLETAAQRGQLSALEGKTDLFIYPGFKFRVIDCLLTNFHLPKSTLFMLVCAFAGRDLIFKAYKEAIKEKYRFYSYGDAMLIL